jgi:hypothetical protein
MPQVARDEYAALVDETLMAVHAADVPDQLDLDTVTLLTAQLEHMRRHAEEERLVRVANIAAHLQRLLAAIAKDTLTDRHAATVRRGLDVLSLLAQDAQRQRDGFPAAALDDAVDCFVDQVERTLRGERGARIMRFPQFRTRPAASRVRVSWPNPPGIS